MNFFNILITTLSLLISQPSLAMQSGEGDDKKPSRVWYSAVTTVIAIARAIHQLGWPSQSNDPAPTTTDANVALRDSTDTGDADTGDTDTGDGDTGDEVAQNFDTLPRDVLEKIFLEFFDPVERNSFRLVHSGFRDLIDIIRGERGWDTFAQVAQLELKGITKFIKADKTIYVTTTEISLGKKQHYFHAIDCNSLKILYSIPLTESPSGNLDIDEQYAYVPFAYENSDWLLLRGGLFLIDLKQGNIDQTLSLTEAPIHITAFNKNVYISGVREIKMVEIKSNKTHWYRELAGEPGKITIHNKDKAYVTDGYRILIFNVGTFKLIKAIEMTCTLTGIVIENDNAYVSCRYVDVHQGSYLGRVFTLDLKTDQILKDREIEWHGGPSAVYMPIVHNGIVYLIGGETDKNDCRADYLYSVNTNNKDVIRVVKLENGYPAPVLCGNYMIISNQEKGDISFVDLSQRKVVATKKKVSNSYFQLIIDDSKAYIFTSGGITVISIAGWK